MKWMVIALLFSSFSQADRKAEYECEMRVGWFAKKACAGVENSEQATYVRECVETVGTIDSIACQNAGEDTGSIVDDCIHSVGSIAKIACAGIRSENEIPVVDECVRRLGTDYAVACGGIESEDQISETRKCSRDEGTRFAHRCRRKRTP